MTSKHKVVFGEMDYLKHASIMLGSEAKLFELFDYSSADLMQLSDTLHTTVRCRDYAELSDRIERLENPGEEDDQKSPASGRFEATSTTVAEEESTTARPSTESAPQEPHIQVARQLRERVQERLLLIAEMAEVNSDKDISSVACDTVDLVVALVQAIETGTQPADYKSVLSDSDFVGRWLVRVSSSGTFESAGLLVKEMARAWDSKPSDDEADSLIDEQHAKVFSRVIARKGGLDLLDKLADLDAEQLAALNKIIDPPTEEPGS